MIEPVGMDLVDATPGIAMYVPLPVGMNVIGVMDVKESLPELACRTWK